MRKMKLMFAILIVIVTFSSCDGLIVHTMSSGDVVYDKFGNMYRIEQRRISETYILQPISCSDDICKLIMKKQKK